MPRVDGEVDEVVDLEQQLEIARFEARMAIGGPYERHTRLRVDRLKRQLARLRQPGNTSRPSTCADDQTGSDHSND